MRKKLTIKQQEILDFIVNYVKDTGYPPAVRDIAKHFKMSSKGAYDHLLAIEKKGYIKRNPTKPRAIELLDFIHRDIPEPIINIPVLGKVAAGEPLLATENVERVITISSDMVRTEKPFALRIKGDSMINAGIMEGDYVIVKQQNTAEQGDIVVALIGDEATVKRFYKETNCVRLQPENPNMNPIIVKDVTILGKVIGLFREI
ncbi:TPA: transcriptional repressor LexA [Candidatus Poribacteria bacterium]|nr:transcriptional repressor LexA [Candidatus Poribacteria bacterium]